MADERRPRVRVVDVAESFRELFGKDAKPYGGDLPEVDWRFELDFGDGKRATMQRGATAEDVAAYIAHELNLN